MFYNLVMENVIEITGRVSENFKRIARLVSEEVLKIMKQPIGLEIAVSFVSENEIKRINSEFRNTDRVTDVLSFPATTIKAGERLDVTAPEAILLKNEEGYIHFGDIAICSKKITSQAAEYKTTPENELKKLVIHSMLHLMGYDHIKDEDFEIMQKQEKLLDEKIKI